LKESGKLDSMEPNDKDRVQRVMEAAENTATALTPSLASDIAMLWRHATIVEVLEDAESSTKDANGKESRLDLDDNAVFFLNKVEDIAKPGFTPSNEEILKVRDPTRTIETIDFQANKAKFRVIDVGGQRMERPKWNLTGEITAVIFVCALTEYNQVLREDVKQNR